MYASANCCLHLEWLQQCYTLYKIGPVLSFPHLLPAALPHPVQNRTCPIISACIACGTVTLYQTGPVISFPHVPCGTATFCTKYDLSYHFLMYCLWHCHTLYKTGPVLSLPHVLPVALPHFVQNKTCSSNSGVLPVAPPQPSNTTWPGFELACGKILQHLVTLLLLLCGMRCVEFVRSGSKEHSLWKLI